jgi:rhamnose utilization protein RhaD (predicted bifunctional aldolase and dehydrogenase)
MVEEGLFTEDQQASFDEMTNRISEADQALSVADIEMQQENAAEVQKAKEAEREAVLAGRKDRQEEMKLQLEDKVAE